MCTGHCSVMMKKDYSYLEALHAAEVYLAYYTNRQRKLTHICFLLILYMINDRGGGIRGRGRGGGVKNLVLTLVREGYVSYMSCRFGTPRQHPSVGCPSGCWGGEQGDAVLGGKTGREIFLQAVFFLCSQSYSTPVKYRHHQLPIVAMLGLGFRGREGNSVSIATVNVCNM